MHQSARYDRWHQTDRNDYTQDWEPDQQSAWISATEQVPQQCNKNPSTQNQGNNEERIPQQYSTTQSRENDQERTQQQYNSQRSTQNRGNYQERMAQQYNPQLSTQNEEESNPQPHPVEYAPEWYLPHRNTLSGSQSPPHNSHTDTAKQQDLYYGQAQYPIRNDQKIDEYAGDVYGYNGEPMDGGTYQAPQQTGNSILDPLVAKGQKELQKVHNATEHNRSRKHESEVSRQMG
ncbi:hypothetical protein QAD02_004864 [Eretmocerus hayati]|uniref:Uncharacterized protein n=1 Tax=Eretmocerus hayati TaxID=131215 RepID=A0ACC2NTQ7_9HYME|nr:hypothetical protein QAD02_004864 [Eretmocerus hayati]